MDLIYGQFKGGTIEDINVLQDYSFDEVYGIDGNNINDFECKVQRYNNKCDVDNVLYVEFTEYGGIIDRIEVDDKTGEVTYKGRTWHGVLNSFVIQPTAGGYSRKYSGEANAILQDMIDEAGIGDIFVADAVPFADRNLEIDFYEVSYEKMYDAIMKMLKSVHGKLIMYFLDGKVHMGAVLCVDYSNDEEFDTGQIPYKVGITENNVNHLICLGKGEGENRAVVHLFTDGGSSEASIQPYKLIDEPQEDNEYILDKRGQILTGKDEICEVLDDPYAEIITNYKPLETQPSDWKTKYMDKYYEDSEPDEETGVVKKQLIKVRERDEYRLLDTPPSDWDKEHYDSYYFFDTTKEPQDYYVKEMDKYGHYTKVVKVRENEEKTASLVGAFSSVKGNDEAHSSITWTLINPTYPTAQTPPPDWKEKYSNYFIPSGTDPNKKDAVSARSYEIYGANDTYNGLEGSEHSWNSSDNLYIGNRIPPNWGYQWSNYVTRAKNVLGKWVAVSIEGNKNYKPEAITKKKAPSDWKDTWSNYYVNVTKKKLEKGSQIVKVGSTKFMKASEAVTKKLLTKISNEKPYPQYKAGRFYVLTPLEDTAPSFSKFTNGVWEKISRQTYPIYDPAKYQYYIKDVDETPQFEAYKYYRKYENVEQIPDFNSKVYYRAVEDRLKRLIEKGIEKLLQLADTSTLDLTLELDSNYDVLDRLGVTDDVTGRTVIKDIKRKIIKIKKYIISVDYEVD